MYERTFVPYIPEAKPGTRALSRKAFYFTPRVDRRAIDIVLLIQLARDGNNFFEKIGVERIGQLFRRGPNSHHALDRWTIFA